MKITLLECAFPMSSQACRKNGLNSLRAVGFFLGCFPLVDVRFRPGLYRVQLDGFLAFFDGGLEVGLSHGCRRFISRHTWAINRCNCPYVLSVVPGLLL